MDGSGKIGLDSTGMRISSGSEKMKRTRLIEPSESGMKVISRSQGFRSPYERRERNKKVSMFLVCVAAIIIVSAVVVASMGGNKTQAKIPGKSSGTPPFPFYIFGYTNDSGGNPLVCNVNLTDLTTGNWTNTVSSLAVSGADGFYAVDISIWVINDVPVYHAGDVIQVVANTTTMTGTNTGVLPAALSPPYLVIDVVVTGGSIPEFTDIVIPIVGMVSIFAVARVASSRSDEQEP